MLYRNFSGTARDFKLHSQNNSVKVTHFTQYNLPVHVEVSCCQVMVEHIKSYRMWILHKV